MVGGAKSLLDQTPFPPEMLRGLKQNLVCTRTQEKGTMTPQGTDSDLPVSVQKSPVEAWVGGGLLQGRGH